MCHPLPLVIHLVMNCGLGCIICFSNRALTSLFASTGKHKLIASVAAQPVGQGRCELCISVYNRHQRHYYGIGIMHMVSFVQLYWFATMILKQRETTG